MRNGIQNNPKLGAVKGSLTTAAVLGLTSFVGLSAYSATQIKATAEAVPGEIVIRLRDRGMSSQGLLINSLEKRLGAAGVVSFQPLVSNKKYNTIRIGNPEQVAEAIAALKDEPSVEIAEPNYIYRAFDDGVPNDPEFKNLWGMKNTGQADAAGQVGTPGADINIMAAWAQGFTGDKKVVVGIIDTGVDYNHDDLKANMWKNPGEIAGDGKDNDGNGYVDDIYGYNFNKNNADPMDDHDHGTHCAGTIGGVGNNGKGVVGVNWNVSIMAIKFLGGDGSGSLAGAINAINYGTKMKANILSNSWGGGGASDAMKKAIEDAHKAGVLFIAAAGNDGSNNDAKATYPASYDVPNVIAVAAVDNQDNLAKFTNYGAKTVHIAAPGVKILSTTRNNSYKVFSGTSMACPHISGITALLLANSPDLTPVQVKEKLMKTSQPLASLNRKIKSGGRVNTYNLLNGIEPPRESQPDESLWKDGTLETPIESAHPYADNARLTFKATVAGAKYIRLVFEKVATEAGYDKILIKDKAGQLVDDISGEKANYTTEFAAGEELNITFNSDTSINGWGFKVAKVQFIQ